MEKDFFLFFFSLTFFYPGSSASVLLGAEPSKGGRGGSGSSGGFAASAFVFLCDFGRSVKWLRCWSAGIRTRTLNNGAWTAGKEQNLKKNKRIIQPVGSRRKEEWASALDLVSSVCFFYFGHEKKLHCHLPSSGFDCQLECLCFPIHLLLQAPVFIVCMYCM